MDTISNSEFADRVREIAGESREFSPSATYDPDGDCIEFIAKPDSFYAERIDDLVTVYYSHETNEIVGSLVKSVSKFIASILEKMPGFKIEIQDGTVRLEHIFLAKLWFSDPGEKTIAGIRYKKLIEIAEEHKVTAHVPCEA